MPFGRRKSRNHRVPSARELEAFEKAASNELDGIANNNVFDLPLCEHGITSRQLIQWATTHQPLPSSCGTCPAATLYVNLRQGQTNRAWVEEELLRRLREERILEHTPLPT